MVWVWLAVTGSAQTAPTGDPGLATVSLPQAIALARQVPSVQAAGAGKDAAQARLEQARDLRLPTLGVSGSVNVWTGAYSLTFPGFGDIPVRDEVTSQLTARVVEPIVGQLSLDHRKSAAEAGVAAAEAQEGGAAVDATFQASDAWFMALQADGQLQIANAQVNSLQSRVDSAQVAFQGGTVTRNDVLKVELALARAQQQVIQVRSMRDASRSRLGLTIGNGGQPVMPIDAPSEPPAVPPETLETLVERAIQSRPDLMGLRAQVEAASQAAQAASTDRLPQVNALAAYTNLQGQGPFAEVNSAFVGASVDWAAWSWGAKDRGVDAARAGVSQLRSTLEGAEAGVRVDVTTKLDALHAALEAWQVASGSIAQAEENLKIQDTLRTAGSGTMTDLLDAEAALVEAKSRTDGALYDAHRAAAALQRALGAEGS